MLIVQVALGIVLAYILIAHTGPVLFVGVLFILVAMTLLLYSFVKEKIRCKAEAEVRAKERSKEETALFFDHGDVPTKTSKGVPSPYESSTDRALYGGELARTDACIRFSGIEPRTGAKKGDLESESARL
jgi:hypothetical protein